MNRETKRAMARQQKTADQGERLQQLRKQQVAQRQAARQTTAQSGKRLHIRPLMQNSCKVKGRKRQKRHRRRG